MRKIYFLLLSSIFFFSGISSFGQVNTMVFIQSSGTYTPVTGGTTVFASGWDDSQLNVALPFAFTFNGTVYNAVNVSSNGFLTFGATAPGTTNYAPISSATGYAGAVSAFGRDIITNASTVEQATIGTAPNRSFVVQWNNARRYNLGAVTGDVLNFQIVLNETSNSIQVIYGTCSATNTTALTCQVGLRGATNADFNNRESTTNWAATTQGLTNTASITSTNTIMPASGLTFTWIIPPPCVAPLNGGTAVGPAGTVCAGVAFNLAVTGASFGTGITYQWEYFDGATWVNVPVGGTGQNLSTSISANTQFRRKMTCSGSDAWSTPVTVTVTPPNAIPFTENFSGYTTQFPPNCWTINNPTYMAGFANSASGAAGSIRYNFFNASSGTQLDLVTFSFTAVPANYRLTFDHAYATYSGEVDQLQIFYSTDGGTTYTSLINYLGGSAGPLNTGGTTTAVFAPTAAQWANKTVALPVGTNKLRFRGLSAFGNMLFLDNITVEPVPPCLPPTNLGTTAIGPTTATLSWTASPSNPSAGYLWEVRTSGAAGSGATGLAQSGGPTGLGVTTANVTGLTPNTTYSAYVRSDCGGGVFSTWTTAYVFTTPCNPVALPINETFATYATTFPPNCWTRNNTSFLIGNAASAYGSGVGSAKFDFYNATAGTNLDLISPLFNPVPANHRVVFDHAYATFLGEVDRLEIAYSLNGGATWTTLTTYLGGTNGPLNTGGSSIPAFTPGAGNWLEKAVDLPVGTNRLRFRGVSAFGNNLHLDNIVIEPTPTCLPPTGLVTAVAISPTEVLVYFNSPGNSFLVEYGTPGCVPGTTNAPGACGNVTFGPSSPILVSGLTPNTTYDFNVRRICIPGVDFSTNKKATATTLCTATNIPYVQDFETSVPLVGFPTCTSMEDVNGNSGPTPNSGGGRWITNNVAQTYRTPTRSLWYIYDLGNPARGGDDYFYLQGLNLTAGTTYRVKAYYKGSDAPTWVENFEIRYGTKAHSSYMTNLIYTSPTTNTTAASPFDSLIADFTPTVTGVYYVGFHNISAPDQAFLFIDDISVRVAPRVDVGITGVNLPALNCPTNGVFVQARIRNYNTTVQNFATYPVTVTANITGAGTGTLTATLNQGTLAPGAEMDIYLSPAFNFASGGTYNITVATSSPDDPETGNDAYTTAVNVNPNPPTPVITPASSAFCLGGQVQLSTQFTNPPPAPVSLPAVTSGAITVGVPDGSPVGSTHTLNVSGVPAGATVTGVSVNINLTHTWVSDMVVNLRAPNNNVLNLFNARGGSGDNMTNMTISSTSTTSLAAAAPPFTGDYMPDAAMGVGPTGANQTSNVNTFGQLTSVGNGSWTLIMRDLVGFDVGTLTSWSITITYQVQNPVVTWTPVTGLFTNSAATTPYTAGTDAFSVYSKPSTAGVYTYTATATSTAGCTSSGTATVTVNANTPVAIGSIPDTVCISDPVIDLVATPVGGSWSGTGVSGDKFIPPATAVGTYTLTYSYTNEFGCTTRATKNIAVKDCPERIILLSDNAVLLYPNPNNGQFNIQINSVLYNNLLMRVYANNGTLVRTQQLGGLAWGRVVPIDLTNLPGGVYMVKFMYEGGVRTSEKTFKVIIGTP